MTTAEPRDAVTGGSMPLVDHLTELRDRLIWCLLAVGVGSAVGFILGEQIFDLITAPLPADVPIILTELGAGFSIRLQVSLVVGVILGMPVILFQIWRFISPGLTPSERRSVLPWIPAALVFFALGVGVAYVVMPYAAQFLLTFITGRVEPMINLASYMDFMSTLFLAFGLLMEFPILLIGLSRVGIVTSARLAQSRRFVILGIVIFSTIATPGGDLISPSVLSVVLYLLYEGTVFFIRRTGR